MLHGPTNVVHGPPLALKGPNHTIRQTDGLCGVALLQGIVGLVKTIVQVSHIKSVGRVQLAPGFFHRDGGSVQRFTVGFELWRNDDGKFVGLLGLFSVEFGPSVVQQFVQMGNASPVLTVQGPGSRRDGLLGSCPPFNHLVRPAFGLTEELFTLTKGTQFHLSNTHRIGLARALDNGGEGFGPLHGVQGSEADRIHIACQRHGTVHVLLALIEDLHSVLDIEVAFLLGGRQEA